MAKGMDSDVSDDDSDSPLYEELLELVHEHQKVIKKQSNKIENPKHYSSAPITAGSKWASPTVRGALDLCRW